MNYSSVNACKNQVKLCTLQVHDDIQLAMAKLSINTCQSKIVGSKPL